MNDQMNAPVPSESTGVSDWFTIWMNAITKPGEQLYSAMAEHPDAQSYNRAFIWVFLVGTVAAVINGLLQGILNMAGLSTSMPGLSDLIGGGGQQGGLVSLAIAVCSAPISGAIAVLGFAIFVGVIQWVARMFKGIGTFSQLAYVTAAISVPFSFVTSFLTPFSTVNVVGICTGGISLIIGLYAMYLQVLAVKAVNKFGWGEAAGSYFIPVILIACICMCAAMALGSMFGLAFSDMLNQGFAP